MFEGLPQTVIDSQVFAGVRWLSHEGIANFDILSFACTDAALAESRGRAREIESQFERRLILQRGERPAMPWAMQVNRKRLEAFLKGAPDRYTFMHARTDYAAAVAGPVARRFAIPLIWDCRGDGEAEFRERVGRSPAGRLISAVAGLRYQAQGRAAARYAGRAVFVTEYLMRKWTPHLQQKPAHVIPCLADEGRFWFDPDLGDRTRRSLGWAGEHLVLIYSGSLQFYQGFDHAMTTFAEIAGLNPMARLLVLTPSVTEARDRLKAAAIDEATVVHARFDEMNGYLNAADCAIMLRPPLDMNLAAFPTKFAEFGMTGLPVLMNDAVPDCHKVAAAAGNLIEPGPVGDLLARLDDFMGRGDAFRRSLAAHYRRCLTRPHFRDVFTEIYAPAVENNAG